MNRYFPPQPKPRLRERGLAMVEIGGKVRPAIVVQMHSERVTIIYGTTRKRAEYALVEVPHHSAAGKQLDLHDTTYFYGDALRSVPPHLLTPKPGFCLPQLWLQLRFLVDGAMRAMTEAQKIADLPQDPPIISAPPQLPPSKGSIPAESPSLPSHTD